ncbi:hypothetical protein RRG08_057665 [Elysia crispata]|uniref:Uncharacterized protein n=1 Tax=Elysia crispata TaxID=231223 RepID=A0AAE1DR67_9GAST|nr:hypothetical protein RRG08_057665 [Elysia crispata]
MPRCSSQTSASEISFGMTAKYSLRPLGQSGKRGMRLSAAHPGDATLSAAREKRKTDYCQERTMEPSTALEKRQVGKGDYGQADSGIPLGQVRSCPGRQHLPSPMCDWLGGKQVEQSKVCSRTQADLMWLATCLINEVTGTSGPGLGSRQPSRKPQLFSTFNW